MPELPANKIAANSAAGEDLTSLGRLGIEKTGAGAVTLLLSGLFKLKAACSIEIVVTAT